MHPSPTQIPLTKIKSVLCHYERITTRTKAPHRTVVLQGLHTGVVVKQALGYCRLAAPYPIAHAVHDIVNAVTQGKASAPEAPAFGAHYQGLRIATDCRELVTGAREGEHCEERVRRQDFSLRAAGLVVAGRTDVDVDAELTLDRYVEDSEVGVPPGGFRDEFGGVVVVAGGAVDEEIFV